MSCRPPTQAKGRWVCLVCHMPHPPSLSPLVHPHQHPPEPPYASPFIISPPPHPIPPPPNSYPSSIPTILPFTLEEEEGMINGDGGGGMMNECRRRGDAHADGLSSPPPPSTPSSPFLDPISIPLPPCIPFHHPANGNSSCDSRGTGAGGAEWCLGWQAPCPTPK